MRSARSGSSLIAKMPAVRARHEPVVIVSSSRGIGPSATLIGSTSPIRSAIDVSGVASFSPKRRSRWTHFDRCVVAALGDEVAGVRRHGCVRVVVDLAARDDRHPLVEQRHERANHAGLRLAALAEEHHVVAGEHRVGELRDDGVVVPITPSTSGSPFASTAHRVGTELFLDRL
jgi:hypothetical protein